MERSIGKPVKGFNLTDLLSILGTSICLLIGLYLTSVLSIEPLLAQLPSITSILPQFFPFTSTFPTVEAFSYYIVLAYGILIPILVAFFTVHISLDLINTLRRRYGRSEQRRDEVVRFSVTQRIEHILLVVSFTLLAISGFALQYPTSFGGMVLPMIGGFETRRLIHLGSAVVMGGLAIFHIIKHGYDLLKDRRGSSIIFSRRDLSDFIQNMKHYLHLSSEAPRFGRYTYAEKFEYWGLIAGAAVIGVSGIYMWFFKAPPQTSPLMVLALIFHQREALLATVTILTWHLYHVMLKPQIFPMDKAWITGRIELERMKKEHPLEYEEIKTVSAKRSR